MLSHTRIWRFEVESTGDFDLPAFPGPLLRSVLGNALYAMLGDEQAEAIFRPGDNPPAPFRFDTPLGKPRTLRGGQRWSFRLVTFHRGVEEVFVDGMINALQQGLGDNRIRQNVVDMRPLADGGSAAGDGVWDEGPDIATRALSLSAVTVRCASPTELKRQKELIRRPQALDVLHAVRQRAWRLGLDVDSMPRFEDEVDELPGDFRMYEHQRRSTAQQRKYSLIGVVGAFAMRPTLAQALWLSLGEVIGIGSDTAQGKGVLRLEPFV